MAKGLGVLISRGGTTGGTTGGITAIQAAAIAAATPALQNALNATQTELDAAQTDYNAKFQAHTDALAAHAAGDASDAELEAVKTALEAADAALTTAVNANTAALAAIPLPDTSVIEAAIQKNADDIAAIPAPVAETDAAALAAVLAEKIRAETAEALLIPKANIATAAEVDAADNAEKLVTVVQLARKIGEIETPNFSVLDASSSTILEHGATYRTYQEDAGNILSPPTDDDGNVIDGAQIELINQNIAKGGNIATFGVVDAQGDALTGKILLPADGTTGDVIRVLPNQRVKAVYKASTDWWVWTPLGSINAYYNNGDAGETFSAGVNIIVDVSEDAEFFLSDVVNQITDIQILPNTKADGNAPTITFKQHPDLTGDMLKVNNADASEFNVTANKTGVTAIRVSGVPRRNRQYIEVDDASAARNTLESSTNVTYNADALGYGEPLTNYKAGDVFINFLHDDFGDVTTNLYWYRFKSDWVEGTDKTGAVWDAAEENRYEILSGATGDPLAWPTITLSGNGGDASTPKTEVLPAVQNVKLDMHLIQIEKDAFIEIDKALNLTGAVSEITIRMPTSLAAGTDTAQYTFPDSWRTQTGEVPEVYTINEGEVHHWKLHSDGFSAYIWPLHGDAAAVETQNAIGSIEDIFTYKWYSQGGSSFSAPPSVVAPRDMLIYVQFTATAWSSSGGLLGWNPSVTGATLVDGSNTGRARPFLRTLTNHGNDHDALTPADGFYSVKEGDSIKPEFGSALTGTISDAGDWFAVSIQEVITVSTPFAVPDATTVKVKSVVTFNGADGQDVIEGAGAHILQVTVPDGQAIDAVTAGAGAIVSIKDKASGLIAVQLADGVGDIDIAVTFSAVVDVLGYDFVRTNNNGAATFGDIQFRLNSTSRQLEWRSTTGANISALNVVSRWEQTSEGYLFQASRTITTGWTITTNNSGIAFNVAGAYEEVFFVIGSKKYKVRGIIGSNYNSNIIELTVK